jgi:hypothetical protein
MKNMVGLILVSVLLVGFGFDAMAGEILTYETPMKSFRIGKEVGRLDGRVGMWELCEMDLGFLADYLRIHELPVICQDSKSFKIFTVGNNILPHYPSAPPTIGETRINEDDYLEVNMYLDDAGLSLLTDETGFNVIISATLDVTGPFSAEQVQFDILAIPYPGFNPDSRFVEMFTNGVSYVHVNPEASDFKGYNFYVLGESDVQTAIELYEQATIGFSFVRMDGMGFSPARLITETKDKY